MGTIECSQPASKSSWDSQDFGDVSMVLKMAHFRKSNGPRWVNSVTLKMITCILSCMGDRTNWLFTCPHSSLCYPWCLFQCARRPYHQICCCKKPNIWHSLKQVNSCNIDVKTRTILLQMITCFIGDGNYILHSAKHLNWGNYSDVMVSRK